MRGNQLFFEDLQLAKICIFCRWCIGLSLVAMCNCLRTCRQPGIAILLVSCFDFLSQGCSGCRWCIGMSKVPMCYCLRTSNPPRCAMWGWQESWVAARFPAPVIMCMPPLRMQHRRLYSVRGLCYFPMCTLPLRCSIRGCCASTICFCHHRIYDLVLQH